MQVRRIVAIAGAIGMAVAALGVLPRVAQASATPAAPASHSGRYIPANMPPGAVRPNIANVSQFASLNWSGYAQNTSGRTYTAVKDTWRVPTVNTTPSGNQYSSDWVGIDGFSNSRLVQCGTEAENIGHTAVYHAWTEILPASEVVIRGLVIHPKDKIRAVVKETAKNKWLMRVSDITTGKSGQKTVSYTTPGTSAEAIHERPQIGSSLANLTHTTRATFDPGSYASSPPSTTPTYHPLLAPATSATVDQIFMINNAGTAVIAAPSVPDSDSDGFTVQDGKTHPPPPSS